jgi:hypothetical protein
MQKIMSRCLAKFWQLDRPIPTSFEPMLVEYLRVGQRDGVTEKAEGGRRFGSQNAL